MSEISYLASPPKCFTGSLLLSLAFVLWCLTSSLASALSLVLVFVGCLSLYLVSAFVFCLWCLSLSLVSVFVFGICPCSLSYARLYMLARCCVLSYKPLPRPPKSYGVGFVRKARLQRNVDWNHGSGPTELHLRCQSYFVSQVCLPPPAASPLLTPPIHHITSVALFVQ